MEKCLFEEINEIFNLNYLKGTKLLFFWIKKKLLLEN